MTRDRAQRSPLWRGSSALSSALLRALPLVIDCPTCRKVYDYSDSEEKFWQKDLPAPPAGHIDRLAIANGELGLEQGEAESLARVWERLRLVGVRRPRPSFGKAS